MKSTKKILKTVNSVLVLFVIVSLTLAVFVAFFRMSGADVNIGGMNLFRIVSGSMAPVYDSGDYIVTLRKAPDKLAVGDIIAFVSVDAGTAGEVIVHRICDIGEDGGFITRGDANPADDFIRVTAENIIGRAAFEVPLLRYADRMFSGAGSFILLIALPIIIIVIIEAAGLIAAGMRRRNICRMISDFGLDPGDEKLYILAEKYGEDAVRQIVVSGVPSREEDKEDLSDE